MRPYARLAAMTAVAAGVLLSAGAGLSFADDGSNGGKDHSSNSGHSSGKSSSGGASNQGSGTNAKEHGNGAAGPANPDKPTSGNSRPESGNTSSGSSDSDNAHDHSAAKTLPDTSSSTPKPETDKTNVDKTDANSEDHGNSGNDNGNGSSDSGSSSSTDTSSTAPSDQPAAADPTGTATTGHRGAAATASAAPHNDTPTTTSSAPSMRPEPSQAPRHTPGASAEESSGGSAVAALTSQSVPAPAGVGHSDTAVNSASTWLVQVGDKFIDSLKAALREVTLEDLALAALPGIAGLLFAFTTGIGLGRRQAKFNFVMENTGALRFAARGPLGVVRSGGFIAVRAARKSASKPAKLKLVDQVA